MIYDDIIGIPFKKGGNDIKGFDCYGLVRFMYSKFFDIEIPSYGHKNIDALKGEDINKVINLSKGEWKRIEKPEVPCALFIRNHPLYINHIGFYVENNQFLHCLKKVGVILSNVKDSYWKRKIMGFYKW
ncbi:MAG: C40 family peptidase [Nanoarchaeota archaeon]|nr:C40 family peptidase [Nanoarchaeota archaeon]